MTVRTSAIRCKLCGHIFGDEKACTFHLKEPHRIEDADEGVWVGPLMESVEFLWDDEGPA